MPGLGTQFRDSGRILQLQPEGHHS